jgi:hypothetical protein
MRPRGRLTRSGVIAPRPRDLRSAPLGRVSGNRGKGTRFAHPSPCPQGGYLQSQLGPVTNVAVAPSEGVPSSFRSCSTTSRASAYVPRWSRAIRSTRFDWAGSSTSWTPTVTLRVPDPVSPRSGSGDDVRSLLARGRESTSASDEEPSTYASDGCNGDEDVHPGLDCRTGLRRRIRFE